MLVATGRGEGKQYEREAYIGLRVIVEEFHDATEVVVAKSFHDQGKNVSHRRKVELIAICISLFLVEAVAQHFLIEGKV